MAVICLLLGVALGYLYRGSAAPSTSTPPNQNARSAAQDNGTPGTTQQMPTLEQMKQMGDKQAEPLLANLKADPRNADLLIQVGRIYESVHQFKEAAGYYAKSLEIDPQNVAIRTEMASCLFYTGDIDGALSQLQQSLKYKPDDPNSLFNLGLIRWKGRNDANGAVTIWKQMLKSNPDLASDKKVQVEKLIADAQQHMKK